MHHIKLVLLLVILGPILGSTQSWRSIKTVKAVYEAYPEQVGQMLDQFDLERKGLEKVRAAVQAKDMVKACRLLLEYYKECESGAHLRRTQPEVQVRTNTLADTTLKDVFIVQNVRGEVPWLEDGHRDWYYKGPNDDREWAWLSNRHTQISQVFDAYFETGNPKYVVYIDEFLRDFIIKSMPYPGVKSRTSVWRGLEVAARAKVWSKLFYGMINSPYFSRATQLLILMSLPDHAHYNRQFHAANNWLTMEISALATLATNFPEYKKSEEWLCYAADVISESMKGQVYSDGVQTELTAHYHNVAMRNFVLFKEICDRAEYELPDFFDKTIEGMYRYLAHAVRPDGNRILNNDGDRGSDVAMILDGAEKYDQPEWEYIATNGSRGVKPQDGPSYFYPWAGQLISRNGYQQDAHWSFFDVGPWGSGHQHNDKLHLSISAYGRDLLVDAGRFAYTGEVAKKFRRYARGTQGHNAVLIDGKGQMPDEKVVKEPLGAEHWRITPSFDYAWNSFNQFYDLEGVKHNRSLLYVRDGFWVVVDKIETETARRIASLWHWHPDCQVEVDKFGIVSTKNAKGNLTLIPIENNDWAVQVIEGQEEPAIQGWYSEEYNVFQPNKAVIHSTMIDGTESFVWLLIPSELEAPEVRTQLLSQTKNGIKLKVDLKDRGSWRLTVPFSDSQKVKVKHRK
ncbi:MAG: alginate lyase family protein [Saprospiraceae bacterium]|nr:alginate lyase family protein [Saprospiraceae bacterium]